MTRSADNNKLGVARPGSNEIAGVELLEMKRLPCVDAPQDVGLLLVAPA